MQYRALLEFTPVLEKRDHFGEVLMDKQFEPDATSWPLA
jgi:hypothetical protein